jgi:hypothetical protein
LEIPIGAHADHPFLHHIKTTKEYASLPPVVSAGNLKYQMKVFMDNYIALAIPALQQHLDVCVHQKCNGDSDHCPVQAFSQQIIHIQHHTTDVTTFLSAFFTNNHHFDVTNNNIRSSAKGAAMILNYPTTKGIPI